MERSRRRSLRPPKPAGGPREGMAAFIADAGTPAADSVEAPIIPSAEVSGSRSRGGHPVPGSGDTPVRGAVVREAGVREAAVPGVAEPSLLFRLSVSAALLGVFGVWLHPLGAWGGAEQHRLLAMLGAVAAALLAAGALRLPRPLRLTIPALLLPAAWLHLADAAEAARAGGWLRLGSRDALLLLSGRLGMVSGCGRLVLLLTGWALLIGSVRHLAAVRGSCGLFAIITFAYLITLERGLSLDMLGDTAAAAALLLWLHSLCSLVRLREQLEEGEEPGSGGPAAAPEGRPWDGAHPATPKTLRASAHPDPPAVSASSAFAALSWQFPGAAPRRDKGTAACPPPWRRWCLASLAAAALVAGLAWCLHGRLGIPEQADSPLAPALKRLQHWSAGYRSGPEKKERESAAVSTGYAADEPQELGRPLHPSRRPVFRAATPLRTYWRGESYDLYTGRTWSKERNRVPASLSSAGEKLREALHAEGALPAARRLVVQRVTLADETPVAGLPVFAGGEAAGLSEIRLADGSGLGYALLDEARGELALPRLPNGFGSGKTVAAYTVSSYLAVGDADALRRSAGGDPPAVRDDLQLPADLPPRVRELAGRLTAAAATRYDAVLAVRNYLRNAYAYTLNTRVPPQAADFVDDFLFRSRRGYCVHFATAMTVLLRSAGIPARYVTGYGPGQADPSAAGTVLVTDADAHAWTEAFFPGAGWVPFDPTPAAAPAPSPPSEAAMAVPARALTAPGGPRPGRAGTLAAPPAFAAALLAAAAAWRRRRTLALLRLRSARGPERLPRAAALAWAGLAARYGAPPPGRTGREYADSLPIDDAGLREAVRRFVRQWETLAYRRPAAGEAESGRMEGGEAFLRDCRIIVGRLE